MINLSSLNKEYSAPKPESKNIYYALLFGLFVACFLIFFEPFDLDSANYPNKTLSLAFYGVISSSVLILLFYLLPLLLPKIYSDKAWKVWHQILYLILALFLISTFNGIWINYLQNLSFSWSNYLLIIVWTFALASIPSAILVLLDYNRSLKRNISMAENIEDNRETTTVIDKQSQDNFSILDNSEVIEYQAKDIMYLEADSNYVNLTFNHDQLIKTKVYRTSLQRTLLDNDLDYIVRCHRSYLINLRHVESVSGNAQGLRLKLKGTQSTIPVSRKYIPMIRAHFRQA